MAKNPTLVDEKKLDLSFKEGQTIKINIGVIFFKIIKSRKFFFDVRVFCFLIFFRKKLRLVQSQDRSPNPVEEWAYYCHHHLALSLQINSLLRQEQTHLPRSVQNLRHHIHNNFNRQHLLVQLKLPTIYF